MSTFKTLFSKDELAQLTAIKRHQKSDDSPTGKPDSVHLPTQKQVQNQVKQLGADYVDDDKVLFMQAMAGVKPLKTQATIAPKPGDKSQDPNALFKRAAAAGGEDDPTAALSDMQALLNPVASEAFLIYKTATLPNKKFEQLKQGKLRWYEAVDLHGSSIDEARQAVLKLITLAQSADETMVKIVHGKGDALLKTCVNGWLQQLPQVLGFISAPAKDGGTGAVLVLLKRAK